MVLDLHAMRASCGLEGNGRESGDETGDVMNTLSDFSHENHI